MRIPLKLALAAAVASGMALASMPSSALAHGYGWRGHHHGWHHRHYGYAPAVSDYYHRSRMLVGTR
jgi:Spy/CpxP family protein refolding chaperone